MNDSRDEAQPADPWGPPDPASRQGRTHPLRTAAEAARAGRYPRIDLSGVTGPQGPVSGPGPVRMDHVNGAGKPEKRARRILPARKRRQADRVRAAFAVAALVAIVAAVLAVLAPSAHAAGCDAITGMCTPYAGTTGTVAKAKPTTAPKPAPTTKPAPKSPKVTPATAPRPRARPVPTPHVTSRGIVAAFKERSAGAYAACLREWDDGTGRLPFDLTKFRERLRQYEREHGPLTYAEMVDLCGQWARGWYDEHRPTPRHGAY